MTVRGPRTRKDRPLIVEAASPRDIESAVDQAQKVVLSGGLVISPTESFYCLAADSTNEQAIRKMFLAKSRSPSMPVLILIPSVDHLENYVEEIPSPAQRLVQEFWPGGLTLLFKPASGIHPLLTAGTGKIGIRLSSHPAATGLARALGRPITGSSANISGRPPCRNLKEILEAFGDSVDLVLNGGEISGEVGSTVLDVTKKPPQIIREGMITGERLKSILV